VRQNVGHAEGRICCSNAPSTPESSLSIANTPVPCMRAEIQHDLRVVVDLERLRGSQQEDLERCLGLSRCARRPRHYLRRCHAPRYAAQVRARKTCRTPVHRGRHTPPITKSSPVSGPSCGPVRAGHPARLSGGRRKSVRGPGLGRAERSKFRVFSSLLVRRVGAPRSGVREVCKRCIHGDIRGLFMASISSTCRACSRDRPTASPQKRRISGWLSWSRQSRNAFSEAIRAHTASREVRCERDDGLDRASGAKLSVWEVLRPESRRGRRVHPETGRW